MLRRCTASSIVLNPTARSASPGTGSEPRRPRRARAPAARSGRPPRRCRSSTVRTRASSSSAPAVPTMRSACGHICRRGITMWRGSTVPAATSGSSGVYSMKFSGETIVAPARPTMRASEAPAKPPPTIRRPPRAGRASVRARSGAGGHDGGHDAAPAGIRSVDSGISGSSGELRRRGPGLVLVLLVGGLDGEVREDPVEPARDVPGARAEQVHDGRDHQHAG